MAGAGQPDGGCSSRRSSYHCSGTAPGEVRSCPIPKVSARYGRRGGHDVSARHDVALHGIASHGIVARCCRAPSLFDVTAPIGPARHFWTSLAWPNGWLVACLTARLPGCLAIQLPGCPAARLLGAPKPP